MSILENVFLLWWTVSVSDQKTRTVHARIQIVLPGVQATIQSETGKRWVERVLSITAQVDWIDNFQYGFAWQTFGVLREGKTSLCSQCPIQFGHLLRTPGESQPEWDPALLFRKIDFGLMYQQFCMVASITNFFDKKLYLPSAALPFSCLTNGKIQSVSNCFFLTEFVQENTFILQWAGGRQHLGMRDGKRRKFHRWKLDMIIPGIHTSHYLPGFWSDSDALLWSWHIENAFLGEHLSPGIFYNVNITTLEASTTLSIGSLSKSSLTPVSILLSPYNQALFWHLH